MTTNENSIENRVAALENDWEPTPAGKASPAITPLQTS